jgi:hypothetical protein
VNKRALTLPLLMLVPAVVWSGLPGVAGVLAGWAGFFLNCRLLLRCLQSFEMVGFIGRIRKNTMLRLLMITVILGGCAAADARALLWGAASLILGQTIWILMLGRSLREKGG